MNSSALMRFLKFFSCKLFNYTKDATHNETIIEALWQGCSSDVEILAVCRLIDSPNFLVYFEEATRIFRSLLLLLRRFLHSSSVVWLQKLQKKIFFCLSRPLNLASEVFPYEVEVKTTSSRLIVSFAVLLTLRRKTILRHRLKPNLASLKISQSQFESSSFMLTKNKISKFGSTCFSHLRISQPTANSNSQVEAKLSPRIQ